GGNAPSASRGRTYPVAVSNRLAQFCERAWNRHAVAARPVAAASRPIAKSSMAYSSVSDAPLGTGEMSVDRVFGTYPRARYGTWLGRSTYQPWPGGPVLSAPRTIRSTACRTSKFRAPKAYAPASLGSAASPFMTPVYPLASGHLGSQPPSSASRSRDAIMSAVSS